MGPPQAARVQRVTRGRFLGWTGLAAGGFLSLTAFQAEGCGIARRAVSIKSALRNWLSVSYSMISTLMIGSLRSPPPFRLRGTSPRESVSHDSQVASLPYESCSLATPMQGAE